MAQLVKNLLEMQETQVRSLGWEDPLEKGMATHSIILAWRIPWTEEPGLATVHGISKNQTQLRDEVSVLFMVQLSHLYMIIGNNIVLTIWTFVGKVMSLLCKMVSRFVIAICFQ